MDVTGVIKNRHDPIPNEFIQSATICFDNFATDCVIFVQDVDDIKRKFVFSNFGEFTNINKQNYSLLFLASERARTTNAR